MHRQNPRINSKSKAIQTKSHTEAYTYTLPRREKGKKIYIVAPKSTSSIWDDLLSLQVLHICRIPQVDCGDLIHCSRGCWERFPFLFFFLHSSQGSALDLDPPMCVGHLRASVLCSGRTGLKEQLIRGLWLTQAGGREG